MSGRLHSHRWVPDATRRKWQDPDAILADIGLRAGFVFMDIGCGEVFFTIPAAREVGESGRVYALDSRSEALAALEEKAARNGLTNLTAAVGQAEDTVLCRSCSDIVFFGMVLHDFAVPVRVLTNAREMSQAYGPAGQPGLEQDADGVGPAFPYQVQPRPGCPAN